MRLRSRVWRREAAKVSIIVIVVVGLLIAAGYALTGALNVIADRL